MTTENQPGFPKYKMMVNGEERWLPLQEAGRIYDYGMVPVHIGGRVLEFTGEVRDITDEERGDIVDIADQWSESK